MPKSPAKARSDARYNKKTYDYVRLAVRKDAELTADDIKAHAASRNESINGFLLRAVKETIDCDRQREGMSKSG